MSEQAGGGGAAPGAGLGRLTENEQKLVAKLLSDPTFFPIEFRTWLKQFIEGSGIIITASQIQGGQGTNIATGLPAGVVMPVAASGAIPVDCLICDGQAKVRTDYPLLFDRIGVAWGAGDGSTTFNIPDLRDRALYGAGGAVAIGQTDGVAFGSRGGPAHKHYFNQTSGGGGSHSHGLSGSTNSAGDHNHGHPGGQELAYGNSATMANPGAGTARFVVNGFGFLGNGGSHSHTVSGSTDTHSGHTHNVQGDTSGGGAYDKPSFAGVIYVISIGTAA